MMGLIERIRTNEENKNLKSISLAEVELAKHIAGGN